MPRGMWEGLTIQESMAPTILQGKMSAPTTLLGLYCAKEVVEYYFYRCTGYGPRYCSLICAPCLTFSVRFLVLTEQASPVG